jgi:hypothetical protein
MATAFGENYARAVAETDAAQQSVSSSDGLARLPGGAGLPGLVQGLWTYAIPAASVIGVLVYGMLRQLYASFYGSLGASPEEVGLGYSETLSLSGMAVLWVLVLPPALVLLARRLVPPLGRRRSLHDHLRLVAPPLALVLLAVGIVWLCWSTSDAAGRAYDGQAVTSVNIGPLQVLGVRAEPATVSFRPGTANADEAVAPGACLLYLGQADGTSVLYDPGPPMIRTIRVQTADVVVDVVRAERQPGQRQHGSVRCENHHIVVS